MKKSNYLFKGVTTDILRNWTNDCVEVVQNYVERIESVDVRVKLTPLEAMFARNQINAYNRQNNTKLRLLKMKD